MTSFLSLVAAAFLIGAAPAEKTQPVESEPAEGRMAAAEALTGIWAGEGWMMGRDGQRRSIRSLELVEPRLGGTVLLIEGRHSDRDDPESIVHHALGLLFWDEARNGYRFRTHLASGQSGDFEARLEPGRMVWTIPLRESGRIEYRIDVSDGKTWRETGWITRDGESWSQIFEMTLERMPLTERR